MKLSLSSPSKQCKKGRLMISLTGEEMHKMTGRYMPSQEARATIRLDNADPTKLILKFDKAGIYKVGTSTYAKTTKTDIHKILTAVVQTTKIEDYGFKAVNKTQEETIEPAFHGQTMIIEVPQKFYRASPPASKENPNPNGKPLFNKIKEVITGLNTLLAEAKQAGFHIDLSVHEGLIKGKASRTQEIDF